MPSPRLLIPALSITMVASWGSIYYAFAVLVRPIQTELQWSAELTVGAYSLALLVAGLSAYPIGRIIDQRGGRHVMAFGSALAGILFLALSQVSSIYAFYALWIGLGVAMAMTLYEPAFAVIVAVYPHAYRKRIAFLTLAGGFASTVFWPLTHLLVENFGWRGSVLVLGALNLLICAPLHWWVVPVSVPKEHPADVLISQLPAHLTAGMRELLHRPSFWLIGLCFITIGFVTGALAVHVIPLFESLGVSADAAVWFAALIGPMQVTGRLVEVVVGARVSPLTMGTLTMLLMPVALTTLLFGSAVPPLLYVFIVVYGAGVGLGTIVRATTPAEMFGRAQYAAMSGALTSATVIARAAGPYAATAVLTSFTRYSAVLTLLLGVATAGAVCYWIAIATRVQRQERAT